MGGGSLVLFVYFLFFGVPFAIDITRSHAARLAWDSLLSMVFFVQHSGMIRRSAKERMARRIPRTYQAALYSIASGTALFALVLLWQPTHQFLFRFHGPARWLALCLAVLARVRRFASFCSLLGLRSLSVRPPSSLPVHPPADLVDARPVDRPRPLQRALERVDRGGRQA
jgi:hypothetical protein